MSRVTIIIPCFNAGEAVIESVQSALSQTHRDKVIVVVNDGSTDEGTIRALGVVRSLNGVRVVDQEQRGAPAARNAGLRVAPADYVQPLDADDLLSPDYVERASELLDAEPAVGVVYGPAYFFGAREGRLQLPEFTVDGMAVRNLVHAGGMFRYEDWLRLGGYREDLLALADYDLWLRMCEIGRRFVELADITYRYRQGQNVITSSYTADLDVQSARYAAVFRANANFFLPRIEHFYKHRFEQEKRVAELEALLSDISSPTGSLSWALRQWANHVKWATGRVRAVSATRAERRGR